MSKAKLASKRAEVISLIEKDTFPGVKVLHLELHRNYATIDLPVDHEWKKDANGDPVIARAGTYQARFNHEYTPEQIKTSVLTTLQYGKPL
jgi:hypothetical protein